jgi:hypothetical protein
MEELANETMGNLYWAITSRNVLPVFRLADDFSELFA